MRTDAQRLIAIGAVGRFRVESARWGGIAGATAVGVTIFQPEATDVRVGPGTIHFIATTHAHVCAARSGVEKRAARMAAHRRTA